MRQVPAMMIVIEAGVVAVHGGVKVVPVASASGVREGLAGSGPVVVVPALNLFVTVTHVHLLVASLFRVVTSSSAAGMAAVHGGVEVVAVASTAGVRERFTVPGLVVEVPALNLFATVADCHLLETSLNVMRPMRLRYRLPREGEEQSDTPELLK